MNSLSRVFAVVKAFIQEFSLITYFLGTIFFIGFSAFSTIVNPDKDAGNGQIFNSYLSFGAHEVIALMVAAAILATTVISLEFVSKELKTEDKGIRFLSLPVSQGERFGAILSIIWLVIPLAVIIPIFVLAATFSLLAPAGILLPDPVYLLPAISISWIAHIGLSLLWLAPAFGYAKRAWFIFMVVLFGIGSYVIYTRNNIQSHITFLHDFSLLQDTSVVGLSHLNVLTDQTPTKDVYFGIGDPFDTSPWTLILIAAFLLGAAYFALQHQKS
ncbi:MAG: hypothetical protein AAGF89_08540 [Bacteroidota bacterium]